MKNNRISIFIHHCTKVYKRVKIDIFDIWVTLEIFLTYTCGSRFKQPTWEPKKNLYHIWLFTTILLRKNKKNHKICIWKMTFFSFSEHLQWFWIVTNCSIFGNILSDFWIVNLPKAALFSLLVRLWTFRALYCNFQKKCVNFFKTASCKTNDSLLECFQNSKPRWQKERWNEKIWKFLRTFWQFFSLRHFS